MVAVIVLASILYLRVFQSVQVEFSMRAGIIDQLAKELPNPFFTENATNIMSGYGLNVSCQNETLDVDFFKNLAKQNYGTIVLRAHSALRDDNSTVDLFTSEPFNPTLHTSELEDGQLVDGYLNYSGVRKDFFALSPKFIENLDSNFPRSVVIMMGCYGLTPNLDQMARAFTGKGATAFIGWDGLVGDSHTDSETLKLLERLFVYNMTIGDSIDGIATDMIYGSRMACYPETARNLRISNLITKEIAVTLQPESMIQDYHSNLMLRSIESKRVTLGSTKTGLTCQSFEALGNHVTQLVSKTVA
jgi:hypothetical protein